MQYCDIRRTVLENNIILCIYRKFLLLYLGEMAKQSFDRLKRRYLKKTRFVQKIKQIWCADPSQPAIACSKLTIETLEQDVNMFKVNNKDTRTTDAITYFTPCSSVSIVNFEQVNSGWDLISELPDSCYVCKITLE